MKPPNAVTMPLGEATVQSIGLTLDGLHWVYTEVHV